MRKFIFRLIFFVLFISVLGEISIRIFKLTSDIPERYIDESGIQRYKPNQSGYYKKSTSSWKVNKYGWVGISDISKDTIISVIGDSYIENMMNPISCNQGSLLGGLFENYSFFEAGRSGVTFIEAMEISKVLDTEVNPNYHLIYVGGNDFKESFSNIKKYSDRMQIDISNNTIIKAKLNSPMIKKILYSNKLLYYMYLRFPIFVKKQNKGETKEKINTKEINNIGSLNLKKLFRFCASNYRKDKIIFVFHENTSLEIIEIAKSFNFKTIHLNSNGTEWKLGSYDGHWSCYGHQEIAKQLYNPLSIFLKKKN